MRTREQEQAAYNGLTTGKVAARLGISPGQVLGLIEDGELRAIDISRKDAKTSEWRVMQEDLDAFEHARENRPREAVA